MLSEVIISFLSFTGRAADLTAVMRKNMREILQKSVQRTQVSRRTGRGTPVLRRREFQACLRQVFVYSIIVSVISISGGFSASAFDITLSDPDVSSDEGTQIVLNDRADGKWFRVQFDFPVTVLFDTPEPYTEGGVTLWRDAVSGNENFGLDDFTLRVYRPGDPIEFPYWEWNSPDKNDGGLGRTTVGATTTWDWTVGVHLHYTDRIAGSDSAWTDALFDTVSGVPSTAHLYSGVRIGGWDNPSAAPDDWLSVGYQVHIEFRAGAFANQVTGDNEERVRNNHRLFPFALVNEDAGVPSVLHINEEQGQRSDMPITTAIEEPFTLEILLTEEPRDATAASLLTVTNGTVTRMVEAPGYDQSGAYDVDGDGSADPGTENIQNDVATGRDRRIYAYVVEITPDPTATEDIVVSVNRFADKVLPTPNYYDGTYEVSIPLTDEYVHLANLIKETQTPPTTGTGTGGNIAELTENRLTETTHLMPIPEKLVIPANGYLVLARGKHNSASPDDDAPIEHSPATLADKVTAAQKLYNVHYEFALPFPANDLSDLFRNGTTLQLLHRNIPENAASADASVGYPGARNTQYAPGAVLINEIMWGLDRTQVGSQYIELHNTTGLAIGIDKNEWVFAIGEGSDPVYTSVVDVVSNRSPSYWPPPGQSGATLGGDIATPRVVYEIAELRAMERIGTNGRLAASWEESQRPSANIHGRRLGTPGAPNNTPLTVSPDGPIVVGPTVAAARDILITEIMADSNAGRLPQWIELTNVGSRTVSLDGWAVSIVNSPLDNVGASHISLDGLEVAAGHVVLIVSAIGRQDSDAVNAARLVNARKPLMSEIGFVISLMPPSGSGDIAGNLATRWDLPVGEIGRRSLVRAETGVGTEAGTWSLAKTLTRPYAQTYYGSPTDTGTPGWHGSGGPLPVELSLLVASRDRVTGAVEIRWETASELNNAGFHIMRSEARDGTFEAVNAAMIPGAGTTSEKQAYLYRDTTAKPNVVYYYQIADVSLAGERQVLTAAYRLRGHLSASGKTTLLWGDLKARE